jgi:hypothetical protein
MSSRIRRHSPQRQLSRLLRRHRPMIATVVAGAVAVIAALFVFSRIHPG